ncbi:hypothetical protein GOP47_0004937 [Adiantum capillus-veneris]|uniref:Uncharacterized protein n=1 Tax=Adiantum capillus-veneris TaxID=13818 RepID=A0A9D4V596_ADICA|nr:hypothetical protein GOP47_0004937 [Adiantum capillus-veneris]
MACGMLTRKLAGAGRRLGIVSPAISSRAPLCRASFSSLFSDPDEAVVEEDEAQLNKYHEPLALVTGASRGLGLEFTRQLLTKYPGVVVYGTARNPDASEGLQALKRRHPIRCELARMDVTKEETVEALAKEIHEKYGRLDLIVNCAGILHVPNEIKPETIVEQLEPEAMMRVFEVNAVGPAIVAKHFWELLKIGRGTKTGRAGAVIAHISTRSSSMKENTLAAWYGYRGSKTALNMLVKTMAQEAMSRRDPVITCLLHPGTVNTTLSKPYSKDVPKMKLFSCDYAVERLLGIINKVRPEDNGKFTSWDRQEVPW